MPISQEDIQQVLNAIKAEKPGRAGTGRGNIAKRCQLTSCR